MYTKKELKYKKNMLIIEKTPQKSNISIGF